jgi:hypothetical protein
MKFKNSKFLATLYGLALSTGPAHSAVIFSDDFTSGTSTALNGQAPQTRPGTETWTAQSVFSKNTTTGVVASTGSGSAHLAVPTLDLTKIYTVTARVTNALASSDADWVGIGFTTQTTNTNAWNVSGTGTYWMFWRGNDEIRAFNGTGATNPSGSTGTFAARVDNTLDLRVVLDFTQGTFGVVSYLYKNPTDMDWTTYSTSNITESLRNGINRVGFTTLDTNTSIHSFEYAVIPEPRAALLGGLGLLMLLRRRR